MTPSTFQRLLRLAHEAVFDKSPGPELALRFGHAMGATWRIADGVLYAAATGQDERGYDLSQLTVSELATALQVDGFDVPVVSDVWSPRSALVLAEGSGTGGDDVSAFTSLLWVLMSSYAGEVRAASHQVQQALRQMVITQSEGEWVDVWGGIYGVPRVQAELDAAYAARVRREAFRERVNARSIELAIRDETGWDVRIEEPWRELFRLDESRLSGGHKFYDGATVGYHLIRPEALDEVDWDIVLPIIERNKPAGVLIVGQLIKPTRVYADWVRYSSREWRGSRHTWASADNTWRGLNPLVFTAHASIAAP